jgi:hypothetical protein
VGDLLRETYTQPAVRGALYEVAADLPGVEFVGRVEDAAGRPGVAVAYTHDTGKGRLGRSSSSIPGQRSSSEKRYVLLEDSTVDIESGGAGAIYGPVGTAETLAYEANVLRSGRCRFDERNAVAIEGAVSPREVELGVEPCSQRIGRERSVTGWPRRVSAEYGPHTAPLRSWHNSGAPYEPQNRW